MMQRVYYEIAGPDSFGSASGLERQRKGRQWDVGDFLSRQDAYTLHKDVKRRFQRRKTLAFGINDLWQADIVDLSSLSHLNDNYRYILSCIDVFSKYGRVAVLKQKTANVVTSAFANMIVDVKPKFLQTDKGTEFLNAKFQAFLADNGIKHYTSENDDIKCAVVERWHRTLLARVYRYFTYSNTMRYLDIIQDVVKSYNSSYHSTIKMSPSEVDEHNQGRVLDLMIGNNPRLKKPRLHIGDTVRISCARIRIPSKGYRERWTEEIFKVTKIYSTNPVTYGLNDYSGEPIRGKFYESELQKVIKDVYRIEKVLKTRKRRGKIEYFVKWLGYADKFNSWTDHIKA
jgi:transposase InsO family protein